MAFRITVAQGRPSLWTGSSLGPEAGLLKLAAMFAGSLVVLGWVRWRHGRVALGRTLADARQATAARRVESAA